MPTALSNSQSLLSRSLIAAADALHRTVVALDRHGAAVQANPALAIDAALAHDRPVIVAIVLTIAGLADAHAADRRIDRKLRERGRQGSGRHEGGGGNQKGLHGRFSVVVPAPITGRPPAGSIKSRRRQSSRAALG